MGKDEGDNILSPAVGVFSDRLSQAEYMQREHPIIYDSSKMFWVWSWSDRSYHYVDETDVLIAVKNATHDRSLINSTSRGMILEAIKMTGRERDVKPLPQNFIQFKDVCVDLKTGDEFEPTPEYMFTAPIPHKLGDSDDTPVLDALFESWVGKDEVEKMFEVLAYTLYPGYPINRIFGLYGSGRNGKSQYIKIMNAFLGSDNTCSTSLDTIATSRFETAKLFKKRAALVTETDAAIMKKTATLKKLSGDDMISGELKGKNPFDFWNYAKIIIATNNLPETDDETDGFYARWVILDFFNQFDEGKSVADGVPEEEYENLCRKCIKILVDLLERGGFKNEGSIPDRRALYKRIANPVSHFIDENYEPDPDGKMKFHIFYEGLGEFIKGSRYSEMSTKAVSKSLRDMGYESDYTRWDGDRKYLTFYGLTKMADDNYPGSQNDYHNHDQSDFGSQNDYRGGNDYQKKTTSSGSSGSHGSHFSKSERVKGTHICREGENRENDCHSNQTTQPSKPIDLDQVDIDRIRNATSDAMANTNNSDGCDIDQITHATKGLARTTVAKCILLNPGGAWESGAREGLYTLRHRA